MSIIFVESFEYSNLREFPVQPEVEVRVPYETWMRICKENHMLPASNVTPRDELVQVLRCLRWKSNRRHSR